MDSTSTLPRPLRLRSPRGGLQVGDRFFPAGAILPDSARPVLDAAAAKAAKVATAEPFVIGILGHSYRVRSILCSASVGTVAFQVIPMDKPTESYHVFHANDGQTCCSCADWEYRRKGTGADCKHGRRLAELGLLPSTTPRILPPFAARGRADAAALDPA